MVPLVFAFDADGNVTQVTNGVALEAQTYTYDALREAPCKGNRLTSWTLTGQPMESYTYNPSTGNLATKAGVSYTYDTNHPHAVASLSNSNSYQQDANGNQTTRTIASGPLAGTYNLLYDAENRIVQVKKINVTVATYAYDGDGRQVQSVVNNVTTLFVGA